jgi:hypothetical protein
VLEREDSGGCVVGVWDGLCFGEGGGWRWLVYGLGNLDGIMLGLLVAGPRLG